jgi:hypothetical protein
MTTKSPVKFSSDDILYMNDAVFKAFDYRYSESSFTHNDDDSIQTVSSVCCLNGALSGIKIKFKITHDKSTSVSVLFGDSTLSQVGCILARKEKFLPFVKLVIGRAVRHLNGVCIALENRIQQ